ncbi:hypothetical protein [Pseudoxanthomonas sp. SE1]|uniref:hypothetical protein n=1 Tax=Pseudoxanthomonas sp. SE1 TaxID=1664560 RepID=UPI00240E4C3E|nr:hypothetical protein [Pseudoxanthomonas sp. SE1]WFC43225.1 hypothetical protein OY559_06865 [Pseudoxanthomonas sp. SE1]
MIAGASEILQQLDHLLAAQGRLLFQKEQYDEQAATQFGVELLDFMRLRGVELRALVATATPGPLTGKYADVLRPFLRAMESELHANAGKGDRQGWLTMSPEFALLEIYYHLAKLQKAVRDDNGPGIREYAADVANMAMMLLDICGGLSVIDLLDRGACSHPGCTQSDGAPCAYPECPQRSASEVSP